MSSDRELLEAAARAAGYVIDPRVKAIMDRDIVLLNERGGNSVWNPLTEDDDAFRLAVKLGIKIELHAAWVYAIAVIRGREYLQIEEGWAQGGDPYAATRRAVVRAAAAMAPHQEDFKSAAVIRDFRTTEVPQEKAE
jgi:hypothetical protein